MSIHTHERRVELYAAVGIAVLALIVAAYAVSQIPKPAPPPKAVANVVKEVKVPAPGLNYIEAGWIYVYQPSVIQVSVNSTLSWIRLGDYWAQGPTGVFELGAGNYTLGILVDVPTNNTVIKVDVRVGA